MKVKKKKIITIDDRKCLLCKGDIPSGTTAIRFAFKQNDIVEYRYVHHKMECDKDKRIDL